MAVLYTVSQSAPHYASTSWLSSMTGSRRSSEVAAKDFLMVSIFILLTFGRFGTFTPCSHLFGWIYNLSFVMMRRWSVSFMAFVKRSSCLALFLMMIKSLSSQCLERRRIHDIMLRVGWGKAMFWSIGQAPRKSGGVVYHCCCNCQLHASQLQLPTLHYNSLFLH